VPFNRSHSKLWGTKSSTSAILVHIPRRQIGLDRTGLRTLLYQIDESVTRLRGDNMKLITIIITAFFMLISTSHAQGGWDVDKDSIPPIGHLKPLPKPTKLKPFTFMFYEVCDSPDSTVRSTGKWKFEVLSQYTMVDFDHHVSDSEVVLKVRPVNWSKMGEKIWFPMKPFTLRIVLGPDTAAFRMDLTTGMCVYVDTSSLLRRDEPKELPADLLSMQFKSRDRDEAKDFLKLVAAQFGAAVEPVVLARGFYPCLPTQVVERTNIGRGKVINETAWGFLICLRVIYSSRTAEVAQWVSERQREEFARAEKRK
jgi:hypothetical protein